MTPPTENRRTAPKARLVTGAILWSVVLMGCGGKTDAAHGTTSPSAGGTSATGGVSAIGGTITTGGNASRLTSTTDVGACSTDSDCTQCVYITAPSNSSECPNALGCCGGQVMNQATCTANYGAWEANCSGQGYTIPICPCVARLNNTISCKNGECGFW